MQTPRATPDRSLSEPQARANASARLLGVIRSLAHRLRAADARSQRLERDLRQLRARNEDLERRNERLARLSVTDELTGLPNHRSFRDALSREIKRALRDGSELALVLFDIDDFKQLNDSYGHAVGDAILARVARVMRDQVRGADVLARYGGEEFALLAPGASLAGAVAIAEKIRLAVSRTAFSVLALEGPRSLQVTVSAGAALFAGCERKLFNDADRALYVAKNSGKDCVQPARA